jgi:hypothetical protein
MAMCEKQSVKKFLPPKEDFMDLEEIILCGASAYTKKYYFNEMFARLPQAVQEELHIMCVLFTSEMGGTLQVIFDEDGHLELRTEANVDDILYDDIGSGLKIKQLRQEKAELFVALEQYYQVFINEDFGQ